MRKGDALTVTRIVRLARPIADLQEVVRALEAEGVAPKAAGQPIDAAAAAGAASLDMLGASADFGTNLRRERQTEGIAKPEGVHAGREPVIGRVSACKARLAGVHELSRITVEVERCPEHVAAA